MKFMIDNREGIEAQQIFDLFSGLEVLEERLKIVIGLPKDLCWVWTVVGKKDGLGCITSSGLRSDGMGVSVRLEFRDKVLLELDSQYMGDPASEDNFNYYFQEISRKWGHLKQVVTS